MKKQILSFYQFLTEFCAARLNELFSMQFIPNNTRTTRKNLPRAIFVSNMANFLLDLWKKLHKILGKLKKQHTFERILVNNCLDIDNYRCHPKGTRKLRTYRNILVESFLLFTEKLNDFLNIRLKKN